MFRWLRNVQLNSRIPKRPNSSAVPNKSPDSLNGKEKSGPRDHRSQLLSAQGSTITFPFVPESSCSAQVYGYAPGFVNVIRKRVTPIGDCASPMRSWLAARMKPECTLSNTELIAACNAPSASVATFPEGGNGFCGSVPNVIVCDVTGSSFVHSAVSPARVLFCATRLFGLT